jgi:hypothetical protein
MNLRLILPEIRSEPAFDEQMVESKFDLRDTLGKVAAHVAGAHVKP